MPPHRWGWGYRDRSIWIAFVWKCNRDSALARERLTTLAVSVGQHRLARHVDAAACPAELATATGALAGMPQVVYGAEILGRTAEGAVSSA